MTPGQAVKARREHLRLSARRAAGDGGISNTAWLNLERDIGTPSYDTQRAVARALHWPDDWLDLVHAGEIPPATETEPPLEVLVRRLLSETQAEEPDGHGDPRVARAIARRRHDLGLSLNDFVAATGLSRQGLTPLLSGMKRKYQERLTMPVCRVLKWSPDSIDRLFRGEDPVELDDESGPTVLGPDTRRLLDKLTELAGLINRLEESGAQADRRLDAIERIVAEADRVLAEVEQRVARLEQGSSGSGRSDRRPRR